MAKVTAQQWLDKWGRRLQAAGPDIQAGVDRTTKNPGALAAAAAQLWAANVQRAATDGTWANNVSKVTPQMWKDAMKNKGIPRLGQGIAMAQQNKAAKITALLSAVDSAAAVSHALPRGGLEQNIARATAFMREMAARAPKRQK